MHSREFIFMKTCLLSCRVKKQFNKEAYKGKGEFSGKKTGRQDRVITQSLKLKILKIQLSSVIIWCCRIGLGNVVQQMLKYKIVGLLKCMITRTEYDIERITRKFAKQFGEFRLEGAR